MSIKRLALGCLRSWGQAELCCSCTQEWPQSLTAVLTGKYLNSDCIYETNILASSPFSKAAKVFTDSTSQLQYSALQLCVLDGTSHKHITQARGGTRCKQLVFITISSRDADVHDPVLSFP
jgi:hypothetical protein